MSEAQPTENFTYEATLNAAASASRFPAGAFLDYAGLKKILEALAEMYATGDRAAEGLAYASLAWNAALSEALQAARLLRAARELTPVCPACPVGRAGAELQKIALNSRVFAVSARPSPDPRTPPDLSRPLRGPYESPRPNPRVQANDGANPYGGVRPLAVPHIQ